jgi:hypothetical protein
MMSLPKREREHDWREVLEGKYKPKDQNEEHQYRFTMRRRAKKIMQDLKLILENADLNDLYMIFNADEKMWEETMFPVASKLLTVVGSYLSPERSAEWKHLENRAWYPVGIETFIDFSRENGVRVNRRKLFNDEGTLIFSKRHYYRDEIIAELKKRRPDKLEEISSMEKCLKAFMESRTNRERKL